MQTILLVIFLTLFISVGNLPVAAQQSEKLPRIGILSRPGMALLRQGLRELGYTEGKNILFESRNADNREQIQQAVVDLVKLNVDVLVMTSQPGIRAAKQATKTLPIVMSTTQDPVALGFVNTLARPGGNITGVTTLQRELSGKRLEVLKEALPELSRVAIIFNATSTGDFKMYEAPAQALKIQVQAVGVQGPKLNLEEAFSIAVKQRSKAVITITNAALNPHAKRIAELAVRNRLPLMAERLDYVEAGALMSYAADNEEVWRRVAIFVDKILKGAKPADLPVEQPTKFDFVINLKTAKQIGVTLPQWTLMKADRVIK